MTKSFDDLVKLFKEYWEKCFIKNARRTLVLSISTTYLARHKFSKSNKA